MATLENTYFKVAKTGYYVYEVNAGGFEPEDDDIDVIKMIRKEVMDQSKAYTDVFIISHGFMTGRKTDGSVHLANRMVQSLEDTRPDGIKPLYIAVKWPSLVTTMTESATKGSREHFDAMVKELRQSAEDPERAKKARKTTSARSIDRFVSHAQKSMKKGKDGEVSDDVVKSLKQVNKDLAEQGASIDGDEASLLDDDVQHTADTDGMVEKSQFRLGRANIAYLLEDIIFGQFERRASNVGSRGVHLLLADLMRHTPPAVKFHLFGHSLGGHVVCSAAIGRAPGSLLRRKVHSMVIAQGALNSRSLARGGAYRPLTTCLQPVAGPILETVFSGDKALTGYNVFNTAPAGRVGFQDVAPMPTGTITLDNVADDRKCSSQKIDLKPGTCYNVMSGAVISSHSDFYDLDIAHLVWKAAQTEVASYDAVDSCSLPVGYWTQFKARAEDGAWATPLASCNLM